MSPAARKAERYIVQALWGARERDLGRDATALANLLTWLREIDPRFGPFYPSPAADAEPGAAPPAEPVETPAQIVRLLEARSREWEHDDRQYHARQLNLTNAQPAGMECAVELVCGIDVPSGSVWFPNRFELQLWGPGRRDSMDDPTLVHAALEAAAEAFAARWGAAGPRGYPEPDLDDAMAGKPLVSWLVYLAPGYGPPPALAPPSFWRPAKGGGSLVAVVGEWLDPREAAHRGARDEVARALERAGMLRPSTGDGAGP